MQNPLRPSRRAFTLLELILVLLIVAIMLGVVSARMTGLHKRSKIDNAAAMTLAMMDQCRHRAVNDGTTYRLAIEPDKRRAWIEKLTPTGYRQATLTDGEYFTWETSLTFESDAPLEEGMWYVPFRPDGSTQPMQIELRQQGQTPRYLATASPAEPFRIYQADRLEIEMEGGVDVPDVY